MKIKILLIAFLCVGMNAFSQVAKDIPFETNFDDETEFINDGWTIENTNDDGESTWMYSPDYFGVNASGSIVMVSNAGGNNDWIFTPPLNLNADSIYFLSFKYVNIFTSTAEDLDVYIGTEATSASMTTKLAEYLQYNTGNNQAFNTSSSMLEIPSSGVYYIGFHAFSPGSYYSGQSVDDFSLFTQNTSGIVDKTMLNATIYPCPATDKLTINNAEHATISIYNTLGELMFSKTDIQMSEDIDVSIFKNGIYIVHVVTNNQKITKQIQLMK